MVIVEKLWLHYRAHAEPLILLVKEFPVVDISKDLSLKSWKDTTSQSRHMFWLQLLQRIPERGLPLESAKQLGNFLRSHLNQRGFESETTSHIRMARGVHTFCTRGWRLKKPQYFTRWVKSSTLMIHQMVQLQNWKYWLWIQNNHFKIHY